MSEQEKFLTWYEKEKSTRNLEDIKFFPADTSQGTQEEFFGELNAINEAIIEGRIVSNEGLF